MLRPKPFALGLAEFLGRHPMLAVEGSTSRARARVPAAAANAALTERGLAIADVVKEVASEAGKLPSQVALAWTLLIPAVTAPIVRARTSKQLEENLGALGVCFTDAHRARLAPLGFERRVVSPVVTNPRGLKIRVSPVRFRP